MYKNKIKNTLRLSSISSPIQPAKTGFTLVEILIVISIFTIFAATGIATYQNAKKRAVLDDAYASVSQAFEQASNRAATGIGTEKHGVHVEKERIVTFEGDTYIEGNGNETPLPTSISTDQIDLTVLFDRINALPEISADTTITINDEDGSAKTITIAKDGRIISQ